MGSLHVSQLVFRTEKKHSLFITCETFNNGKKGHNSASTKPHAVYENCSPLNISLSMPLAMPAGVSELLALLSSAALFPLPVDMSVGPASSPVLVVSELAASVDAPELPAVD